jgi:hypothetical protein
LATSKWTYARDIIEDANWGKLGRISCELPKGQGRNVSLVVSSRNQQSFPRKLHFQPPTADWDALATLRAQESGHPADDGVVRTPTTGAELTIEGENFGFYEQKVWFGERRVSATNAMNSADHTKLRVTAPPGEGANLPIWVVVAGQKSAVGNFSYVPPSLAALEVKGTVSSATEGLWKAVRMRGANLGDDSLLGGINSAHRAWLHVWRMNATTKVPASTKLACSAESASNHTEFTFTTPVDLFKSEQNGANFTVEISGQFATFHSPIISSVAVSNTSVADNTARDNMAATKGGATLTLGMAYADVQEGELAVTVGGEPCTDLKKISNSQLTCVVPAGQGANQPVLLRAGWLRSRTVQLSYLPPTIDWASVVATNMSMPDDSGSIPPNERRLAADGGWNRPPTQGQLLTLTGENLGTSGTMQIDGLDVATAFDRARCGGQTCGLDAGAHTHDAITLRLPAWVGSGHVLDITIGGQSTSRTFSYAMPTVDPISCAGINGACLYRTEGGSLLTITGANFGHPSFMHPSNAPGSVPATTNTSTAVLLGPSSDLGVVSCTVKNFSHTAIVCEVPAGQGKDIPIAVSVDGQQDASSTLFSYSPPSITNVSALSDDTSGGKLITLTGRDFGINGTVQLGEAFTPVGSKTEITRLRRVLNTLEHDHTRVVFRVPEDGGFGGGRRITLDVSGQASTYANGVFTYNAPTIFNITSNTAKQNENIVDRMTADERYHYDGLPTNGESDRFEPCYYPECRGTNALLITITGSSFGNQVLLQAASTDEGGATLDAVYSRSADVRLYFPNYVSGANATAVPLVNGGFQSDCAVSTSADTMCKPCKVVSQKHNQIICMPGAGAGKNLNMIVERRPQELAPGIITASKCGIKASETGGFPICTQSNTKGLHYRPPTLSSIDPTKVDAMGGEDIILLGNNFGPYATAVTVLIGGKACEDARWNAPWSAGGEGFTDGPRCSECARRPYLTCKTPTLGSSGRFPRADQLVCTSPPQGFGTPNPVIKAVYDREVACTEETQVFFGGNCTQDDALCWSAVHKLCQKKHKDKTSLDYNSCVSDTGNTPMKVCPMEACVTGINDARGSPQTRDNANPLTDQVIYAAGSRTRACELDDSCRNGMVVGWQSVEVSVAYQGKAYSPNMTHANQAAQVLQQARDAVAAAQAAGNSTTAAVAAEAAALVEDQAARDKFKLQAACTGGSAVGGAGDGFYGDTGERCTPCPEGAICHKTCKGAAANVDTAQTLPGTKCPAPVKCTGDNGDTGLCEWQKCGDQPDGAVTCCRLPLCEWPKSPMAQLGFYRGKAQYSADGKATTDFEGQQVCSQSFVDVLELAPSSALPSTSREMFEESGVEGIQCPLFQPCEPKEACLVGQLCAVGYGGARCSLCAEGFFKLSGVCEPCPSCPVCLLIFVCLFLAFCAVCGYILAKKRINLCMLTIGVDYFQVLSLLVMSNKIKWPAALKRLITYLGVFNINLDLMAPECSLKDFTYTKKWFCIETLPLIFITCFLIFHFAVWFRKRCILGRTKKLHNHAHLVVGMSAATFYYLYLYISKTILDVFNCAPTDPPDGKQYLEVVFEDCAKPGGTHLTLLPYAIIAFCFYTLGFPLLCGAIILKNAQRIQVDQKLRALHHVEGTELKEMKRQLRNKHCWNFRKRFHRLYYHYKPQFYYWILVILGRKFLVATCGLIFRKSPVFLMSVLLVILFVSYALQMRNQPYMSVSEMDGVADAYQAELKHMQDFEEEKIRKDNKGRRMRMGSGNEVKQIMKTKRAEKRQASALLYFWNYNTMEATLLFSASMTVLCGLMFQSEQMKPAPDGSTNSWADGLFWVTMSIILVSTLYFFTIFFTELATAFGYSCHWQRKKAQAAQVEKLDIDAQIDMGHNPLHLDKSAEADSEAVLQSREDLLEAQATIQQMQDELKSIKQERKRAELGAMGSFKQTKGSLDRARSGNSKRAKKKIIGGKQSSGDHLFDAFDESAADGLPLAAVPITGPSGAVVATNTPSQRPEGRLSIPQLSNHQQVL